MQAVTQPRVADWQASASDTALELIDAAVHDMPAGILVVTRESGEVRIAYANDAMQSMTGYLLAERSEVRLADVPLFGEPLLAIVEEAGEEDGRVERSITVQDQTRKYVLQVQVRPLAANNPFRLVRLETLNEDPQVIAPELTTLARCADSSGLGHWHWDLVTGAAWYDAHAARLLGASAKDASAKLLHSRVHDNDREAFLNAIRRHLEQNLPLDVEFRLRPPADDTWLRLRGSALREGASLPSQLCGVIEEVTERRRSIGELNGTQEFLRGMFDSLRTCIAVLNAAGEIIELNRAWTEFPSAAGLTGLRFGYGENYPALCRAAQERCAAGRSAADGIERVLSGAAEEFILDYRAVCLESSERAMHLVARPFVTAKGHYVLVTHTDSTSVERATRAMRENDAFYRMILNEVPLYISYVNDQRELVHANRLAEEWLGQPIDVLRGRRLEDLMDSDGYAAVESRVESVLRGRRIDFESHVERDSKDFDIAVSYVPHVVDGAVEGFFSVARDVTQEKRLESELLQSQKMEAMGRLTGGIAHDFNNLLSVVIGNLQLLEREIGDQAVQQSQVRTALGAASRGADLTRRLLSFARPKARDATPIDVNSLIGGLEDLIERTLGSSIELGIDLDRAIWPIRVDAGELENALLNLAINARDAMSAGGTLRVTTRNVHVATSEATQTPSLAAGNYVEVSVRDSGCGMPSEVVKKAFEPFFTTKEPGKGTGLGLSIVYGFAIRSGGTALIESTPGAGTAVRLFFPRGGGIDDEASAASSPAGASSVGRVLVVDDDASRRRSNARLLRDAGFQVDTASDAAGAIDAVRSAVPPDVVVLAESACGDVSPEEWSRLIKISNRSVRVLHRFGSHPPGAAATPGVDLVRIVRSALAQELAEHV